jgi:hypothetical protein
MASFVWADGVRVAGTRIWCDAARAHGLSFVAHAGVAPPARRASDRLLCTERTLRLLEARGASLGDALVAPYGRPFAFGRTRLELLPSGRMPGAAQLRVQLDGRTLLYAGDVWPDAAPLAEPAQLRPCDVLALTLPAAPSVPSRAAREAALLSSVRAALAAARTPAILAAPDEAAAAAVALAADGVALAAHPQLAASLRAWRRLGHAVPPVPRARPPLAPGVALLWPRARAAAPSLARLEALPIDAALAAPADLPSLVDYAAASGAREVLLVGAAVSPGDARARECLRAFAAAGLRARALGPPQQMRLL